MERINKKVSLEKAKNRFINIKPLPKINNPKGLNEYLNKVFYFSKNEFYDDDKNWGGECVDIIIPEYVTVQEHKSLYSWATKLYYNAPLCVPMEKLNGNRFLLRYKNMMCYYHWIMNTLIPSCVFYMVCKDRYRKVNLEFDTRTEDFDHPFFKYNELDCYKFLPDIKTIEKPVNNIICVTEFCSEIVDKFINFEFMGDFVIFCNYLFNHGLHSELNEEGVEMNELVNGSLSYETPYMTIPLILNQHIDDIGLFTPIVETWVPKKKYYLGDVVYYNGDTYVLNRATDYDLSYVNGAFGDVFDRGKTTEKTKMQTKDYNHNYIIKTSKSDLPSTFIYNEFATKKVSERTNEEIMRGGKTNVYVVKENNQTALVIPYHCGVYDKDTRLTTFVKQTEGNNSEGFWVKIEYPFFMAMNDLNAKKYVSISESHISDYKRRKTSSDNQGDILPFIVHTENGVVVSPITELQYRVGIVNKIEIGNNKELFSIDGIDSIQIYEDYTSSSPLIVFNNEDEIILNTQIPSEGEVIRFTYYSGRKVDKNGNVVEEGLIYNESYWFTHDTVTGIVIDDLTGATFDFININDTNSLLNVEGNDDIDLLTNNPIYSNIEVSSNDVKYDDVSYAHIYKDEALFGVIDINNEIDANISRGTSAALERHNILGEIKTIQDMENYRNNYFEI